MEKNRLKVLLLIVLLTVSAIGITVCISEKPKPEELSAVEKTATDYSDVSHWYQIPEITEDVDTFYLYPTLYNGNNDGDEDYADIDNAEMIAAVESVYQGQASAFEGSTNVFVPYYRQSSMMHEIEAFEKTGNMEAALEGIPLEDAIAALDYYFENYNDGRPFILAGHSQGSAVMKLVLKTYFKDHPEYYSRMIAAYIIGYSVTIKDLEECPYLKFASGETDTGVIVSWNTEGQKNVDTDAKNMVVQNRSIAINPLNWKRDETYAPASENLGSLVMNPKTGEYEISDIGADAQVNIERGVVVTNANADPVTNLTEFFGPQSFHTGDYSFFYMNIRDNANKRIEAYMTHK